MIRNKNQVNRDGKETSITQHDQVYNRIYRDLQTKDPGVIEQIKVSFDNRHIEFADKIFSNNVAAQVRKELGIEWEDRVKQVFPNVPKDDWDRFVHGIIGQCLYEYIKISSWNFDALKKCLPITLVI